VRERIEREYSGIARQKLKRELLDQLAARFSFGVPAGMLDLEFQHLWREVEVERKRAKESGKIDPELAKDDAELKAEFQALSERRVRLGLLLNEIGRTNSITIAAEELNRAVIDRARGFPGQEREVLDFYRNNPQALDSLRAPIYEDKVVDFILAKVNVSERSVPPAELTAAAAKED